MCNIYIFVYMYEYSFQKLLKVNSFYTIRIKHETKKMQKGIYFL